MEAPARRRAKERVKMRRVFTLNPLVQADIKLFKLCSDPRLPPPSPVPACSDPSAPPSSVSGTHPARAIPGGVAAERTNPFFALTDDALLLIARLLLFSYPDALRAWASACRLARVMFAGDPVGRALAVALDPTLRDARPGEDGLGGSWGDLWRARANDLGSRAAIDAGRVPAPEDRAVVVLGTRSLGPARYVGRMDANLNPHGYGILHWPTAGADPDGERIERAGPEAARGTERTKVDVDVVPRLNAEFLYRRDLYPVFRTDEECDAFDCALATHSVPTVGDALAHAIREARSAGQRVVSEGDRIEGVWHRGVFRHGIARCWDPGREDRYEGEIRDGFRDGRGKSFLPSSGAVYEGCWREGKYHGRGSLLLRDGSWRVDAEWADGARAPSTPCALHSPNGTVSTGDFGLFECDDGGDDGEPACVETRTADGVVLHHQWRAGVPLDRGYATMCTPSGHAYAGQWADGRASGMGIERDPCGAAYEGTWSDGRPTYEGVLFCGVVGFARLERRPEAGTRCPRVAARVVPELNLDALLLYLRESGERRTGGDGCAGSDRSGEAERDACDGKTNGDADERTEEGATVFEVETERGRHTEVCARSAVTWSELAISLIRAYLDRISI